MRIQLKQTVVFVIFAAMLFVGCSKQVDHPAGSDFVDGMAKLEKFDYEGAKEAFEIAGEENSTRPVAWLGKAYTDERQLMYLDALNNFMVVSEADSTFPEAFVGICRIMSRMGWHDIQLEEASKAVNRFPDNLEINLTLATAFIEANLHGRVIRLATKLEELGLAKQVSDIILARVYWLEGQADSSNYYYEQAGNLETGVFYEAKADYFETTGFIDSAVIYGEKAIKVTNGSVAQKMNQFHRSIRMHTFTNARAVMADLKKLNCGETVLSGMTCFYYKEIDDRPMLKMAATEFKLQAGDCVSSAYNEMIARGLIAQNLAVTQERRLMESIMTKRDYNLRLQEFLNYVTINFFAQLDFELDTIEELKTIRRGYANQMDTKLNVASLHYKTGSNELGKKEFETIYKQYSKRPVWLNAMGDLMVARHWRDSTRAIELFEQALTVDELNVEAFQKLVAIKRARGQYKEALALFDQYPAAVQMNKGNQILKATVLVESGDSDNGLELFKTNFTYCSQSADQFSDLLESLDRDGNIVSAKKLNEIGSEIGKNNTDLLITSFDFLITIDENELAGKAISAAVTVEPDWLAVMTRSHYMTYLEGDFDSAFEGFEKDLAVNENDQDANYFMSLMLSREQKDPSRATNLARRANFSSFMSYRNWMNLCFAYYQMGRYDLCRGEARKASRKFKTKPLAYYYGGMVMFQDGDPEFETQLIKAINLGLRGKELEIANQALADTR